jgi:hypothetical protein
MSGFESCDASSYVSEAQQVDHQQRVRRSLDRVGTVSPFIAPSCCVLQAVMTLSSLLMSVVDYDVQLFDLVSHIRFYNSDQVRAFFKDMSIWCNHASHEDYLFDEVHCFSHAASDKEALSKIRSISLNVALDFSDFINEVLAVIEPDVTREYTSAWQILASINIALYSMRFDLIEFANRTQTCACGNHFLELKVPEFDGESVDSNYISLNHTDSAYGANSICLDFQSTETNDATEMQSTVAEMHYTAIELA